jgi:hypothetical protein
MGGRLIDSIIDISTNALGSCNPAMRRNALPNLIFTYTGAPEKTLIYDSIRFSMRFRQ